MIDTGAGVVDPDYRGVIFVLLFNHSDKDFQGMLQPFIHLLWTTPDWCTIKVEEGDRIAQIIFEKIYTPEVQEVDVSISHLYSSVGDVVTTIYTSGPWSDSSWSERVWIHRRSQPFELKVTYH